MSIFDGYRREESARLEPGDYRVAITEVEETVSKSGNPMLVVTVRPSGSDIRIKHYIVKNDYFNRNLTSLKDSFGIADEDNEILGWIGAAGAARLAEDDRGYLKARWFIHQNKQGTLPPWEGEQPNRQQVQDFEELADDDDLPF